MKSYYELAQSVKFGKKGLRMTVLENDPSLTLAGVGRSACAFRVAKTDKVLKVYFPSKAYLAAVEAEIYEKLAGVPFYPALHEEGGNYIVIDFIAGETLFDCLAKGLPVREKQIKEIDTALLMAKKRGLNPSDVHLRNIFITISGNIKIIDVARFRQAKHCEQWDDLKAAFYILYIRRLFPKKLPTVLLNLIAMVYKKRFIPAFK